MMINPQNKYRAFTPINLPDRQWPSATITKPPMWCSVDLRDGNQSLIEPMGHERKMRMWNALLKIGFKEIEIGFPSASQTDFDFCRHLIDNALIPDDVTIQVLVQCREDLIRRTFEGIQGAKHAIVHFYNSTSELQRRVVFQKDRAGVRDIAVNAAKLVRSMTDESGMKEAIRFQYSPESFMGTELDYAQEICEAVIGLDASEQAFIDKTMIELDGSEGKSRLGANSILAVSMACAKAAADESGLSLYRYLGGAAPMQMPVPMMNIINGGAHADNVLDMQEFMIIPAGLPTFREALRAGVEIFHTLKKILHAEKHNTNVGDEGGFAPNLANNEAALQYIMKAIAEAGYTAGEDILIGIDCASSEFRKDGKYRFEAEKLAFSSQQFTDLLSGWCDKYPIISIEDGMAEDDWDGWATLTEKLGKKIQLVGDDLFVTNTKILREGISKGIANSILIKVNQIGTLSETFAAIEMAKRANYTAVISHRSGETEDTTIADIAVGMNALQIKTGSASRSDRMAKYNQLLRIEEELGDAASYAGKSAYYNLQKPR